MAKEPVHYSDREGITLCGYSIKSTSKKSKDKVVSTDPHAVTCYNCKRRLGRVLKKKGKQ